MASNENVIEFEGYEFRCFSLIEYKSLIELLKEDPFKYPPAYEKLTGDLKGLYSRRINFQHRLVYCVDIDNKIVKIVSTFSHYDNI